MKQDGFDQLTSDGDHRIQRGHRILKDHGDIVAAYPAQLSSPHLKQILTFEKSLARDPGVLARDEAQHGQTGDGFPGA